MSSSFGSKDIQILAAAYRRAWDSFVRTGELTRENVRNSQTELARSICDHAGATGSRDERRLAGHALAELQRRSAPSEPEARDRNQPEAPS